MKENKSAFVCWRPYQVINAINIVNNNIENSRYNSDIFLLETPSLIGLIARLKEKNIFRNVITFKENISLKKHAEIVELIKSYIYPKKYVMESVSEDVDAEQYGKIFASGWVAFFVCLAECNPKAEIIMYEDGLATYFGTDTPKMNATKFNRMFYKLTGKGKLSINVSKIYVYKPELLEGFIGYDVYTLPAINENVLEKLNDVFGYTENKQYKNKKIIYLDQPYENDANVDCNLKYEIFGWLEKKNIEYIIRMHPVQEPLGSGFPVDTENQSWELAIKDLTHDVILMSVGSTALFTPYILYNESVSIILLHRIFMVKDDFRFTPMQAFADRYNRLVKESIHIPNSIEELKSILNEL